MTDRAGWRDRHRRSAWQRGADDTLVRQLVGDADRLADVLGNRVDVYDVLDALADTGLVLVRDGEGYAGDARRWGVFLLAADPLDVEPPVDSHWDREQEDRDAANLRKRRRTDDTGGDG